MALKVGELYGVLRLDSDQFDRGLDGSGKRFEGLRKVVGTGVQVMATAFATTATAVVGIGLAALKVGLDYNRMQQSSRAALTTLLGSAEAANEQMEKLDDFASNSPFAKQVFIQAQQQLIGFGMAAKDVLPTLDAIQNAVAAVGGSNEDISEITRVLAQVTSSGKITAETFNQLGARGIDAATLIGDSMGKTGAEIRDAVTSGSIDAGEAIKALTDGMTARFGGSTDLIKEQMDGAADRIKGAFRDIGSVLAAPFVDPKGGGMLVIWTNDVADAMRAFQAQLSPVVDLLVQRFAPGLERVSPLLQSVKSAIDSWDVSRLNRQLDEMSKYAPLIAGVGTALFAMGSTSLPVIGRFVPALNPVIAGLAAMVAFSPELRQAGTDFFQALSPLVPIARELGGVLADSLMGALRTLTPAMSDLLLAAAEAAVVLGVSLAPALVDLMGAASPIVGVIADVVSWIAALPTPLLIAAAAVAALHGPLAPLTRMIGAAGLAMVQFGQRAQIHAALGNTNMAMGAMSVAANGARLAVNGLSMSLKAAFISNVPLLAITAIVTAVTFWATENAKTKQTIDGIRDSLDQQTGAITDNTRALALKELQDANAVGVADALGLSLETVIDAMVGNRKAADEVTAAMSDLEAELLAAEIANGGYTIAQLEAENAMVSFKKEQSGFIENTEKARVALDQEREAGIRSKDAHGELATAVGNTADAVKRGDDAVRALTETLDAFSNGAVDAREAELRFMDAVDAATEAAKGNTDGLDDNTKSGRDNERALIEIATRAKDMAVAVADSTGSQSQFTDALGRGREELVRAARQFGMTKAEAEAYADEVLAIPATTQTKAMFDDIAARNRIAEFKRILSMPTVRVGVDVARTGYYENRADGGVDDAGRHVPRIPQTVTGGRNIMWGEPETGWESYISGKPSARQRNLAVMDETARRLGGVFVRPMANGGVTGASAGRGAAVSSAPGPVVARLDLADIHALGDYILSASANGTSRAFTEASRATDLSLRMG